MAPYESQSVRVTLYLSPDGTGARQSYFRMSVKITFPYSGDVNMISPTTISIKCLAYCQLLSAKRH